MMSISDNKKFCDNTNSGMFFEKNNKSTSELMNVDFVKANNAGNNVDLIALNNNNTIKSERLSPQQNGDNLNANSR